MWRLIALLIAAASTTFASAHPTANGVQSRYTDLEHCIEIELDQPGRDFVHYRCEGLADIPVWLTYADSARTYLGFGKSRQLSTMFGLNRDLAWPVEWRGIIEGGRFRPFAIIMRMRHPLADTPTDGKSFLYVFRLARDGTACTFAVDLETNEEARQAADRARTARDCDR